MENEIVRIDNEKSLLKAAQSVWAANKYFVLACSQDDYNEVRRLLKPENNGLTKAYKILNDVNLAYYKIPSSELPHINNALYHMAGYFKKLISKEKRDEIIYLIENNSPEAINVLENLTKTHHIDYLLYTRIWADLRGKPFNSIPVRLKNAGIIYCPHELLWLEDHLACNPDYVK